MKQRNATRRIGRRCAFGVRRRRGFASFTAVVLVGTTAIVLTAVAGLTVHQAQRTRDAATDAQLRQLLRSGQVYTNQLTTEDADQASKQAIRLPETLADDGAALTIERKMSEDEASMTAIITATIHERSARQTLIYDSASKRWTVTEVEMP